MKVEGILFVMSLLGTLSHSSKLLKVPRIYNALITSDENLLPSQAYPALTPVVHGLQYPLPGYVATGLYRTAVVPNQVQINDGRSFTYAVKEDFYHYNYVESGQPFKIDLPKIPEDKPVFGQQPALFRPVVPVTSTGIATAFSYSTESSNTLNSFDSNRKVYYESSPVQQGADAPSEIGLSTSGTGRYGVPKVNVPQQLQPYPNRNSEDSPGSPGSTESNKQPDTSPDLEERKPQPDLSDFGTLVKNNRPDDPNIVDVPPPPLPVGSGKSNQKKPEEYPPPPLGYVL